MLVHPACGWTIRTWVGAGGLLGALDLTLVLLLAEVHAMTWSHAASDGADCWLHRWLPLACSQGLCRAAADDDDEEFQSRVCVVLRLLELGSGVLVVSVLYMSVVVIMGHPNYVKLCYNLRCWC